MEEIEDKFKNVCLLPKEIIDILKEIFHNLNKNNDLAIQRKAIINKVRSDERITRVLHKPAVHLSRTEKILTLDMILDQIEQEEIQATGESKKSKEFISLSQFLKYFTNYDLSFDNNHSMIESPTKQKFYFFINSSYNNIIFFIIDQKSLKMMMKT